MTVERGAMVEWWPLVDIGRLDLKAGDRVIVRTPASLSPESRGRLRMALEKALPGIDVLVADAALDFIVRHAMREMRAEDLDVPRRPTTME